MPSELQPALPLSSPAGGGRWAAGAPAATRPRPARCAQPAERGAGPAGGGGGGTGAVAEARAQCGPISGGRARAGGGVRVRGRGAWGPRGGSSAGARAGLTDGRTDWRADQATRASAQLGPSRTQLSPVAARSPVRGHGASPRPRPMGSQVSCAGSLSARPGWRTTPGLGLKPWREPEPSPGRELGSCSPGYCAPGAPPPCHWPPVPPGGGALLGAMAPGDNAAGDPGPRGHGPSGVGGAARQVPAGLSVEAAAARGFPAPWHLRQPLRPPGSFLVTSERGFFQLVISAASTPGPGRQPGGVPAPPALSALCVPRPLSGAAPGPARAEFAKSQNCRRWALQGLGGHCLPRS